MRKLNLGIAIVMACAGVRTAAADMRPIDPYADAPAKATAAAKPVPTVTPIVEPPPPPIARPAKPEAPSIYGTGEGRSIDARIHVLHHGQATFESGPLPAPLDQDPLLAGVRAGYVCDVTGGFWSYFELDNCRPAAIHGDSFDDSSQQLAAAIRATYPEPEIPFWTEYGWGFMSSGLLLIAIVAVQRSRMKARRRREELAARRTQFHMSAVDPTVAQVRVAAWERGPAVKPTVVRTTSPQLAASYRPASAYPIPSHPGLLPEHTPLYASPMGNGSDSTTPVGFATRVKANEYATPVRCQPPVGTPNSTTPVGPAYPAYAGPAYPAYATPVGPVAYAALPPPTIHEYPEAVQGSLGPAPVYYSAPPVAATLPQDAFVAANRDEMPAAAFQEQPSFAARNHQAVYAAPAPYPLTFPAYLAGPEEVLPGYNENPLPPHREDEASLDGPTSHDPNFHAKVERKHRLARGSDPGPLGENGDWNWRPAHLAAAELDNDATHEQPTVPATYAAAKRTAARTFRGVTVKR
ncbi:MAG: hypothetical protein ABI867_28835 [Kofleriaceae bacterium]